MARWAWLGVVASLAVAGVAAAQNAALLSEPLLQRQGLVRQWFTQIETDRIHGRLAYLTQHVSAAKSYTVFEIEVDGRTIAFSEREVDRFGNLLGKANAEQMAKRKVLQLQVEGKKPKLTPKAYPDIILMAVSERGVLQVLDADTGRTRWVLNIGDPLHPSTAAGANDTHVAVCHGSSVFIYDRDSGRLVWTRKLGGAPGAGPALGHEFVYIPFITGRFEAYRIDKPETPPWIFQASGRALLQPTITPYIMNFVTDRGYVYAALLDQAAVKYKFEAHDGVVGATTHGDPRSMYLASIDGYVYCVDEPSGNEKWKFSTGEPILRSPAPIGDAVYAICERAGMYSISSDTGQELWWTPQVKQFVAASKDRVYVIAENRRLTVLDARSGGRLGTLPTEEADLVFTNMQTDRIILGTRSGLIQCIHETSFPRPIVHVLPLEKGKTPGLSNPKPMAQPMGDMPAAPAGDNPFDAPMPMGNPADPFGDSKPAPAAPAPAAPAAPDPFGM